MEYVQRNDEINMDVKKNPGRGREFFFYSKRPGVLWGPYSFLFNWYRVSFAEVKWPGV